MYSVTWMKQARKDHRFIIGAGLSAKLAEILNIVRQNPFEYTQARRYEKLSGYNPPIYTRRLDLYNRFVYTVEPNDGEAKDPAGVLYDGVVVIHRMWGHFP